MKTVCPRHVYAYDVSASCPYCEVPSGAPAGSVVGSVDTSPLTLQLLMSRIQMRYGVRPNYQADIRVNERIFVWWALDQNSHWLTVYSSHSPGGPLACLFGMLVYIDNTLPDHAFMADGVRL